MMEKSLRYGRVGARTSSSAEGGRPRPPSEPTHILGVLGQPRAMISLLDERRESRPKSDKKDYINYFSMLHGGWLRPRGWHVRAYESRPDAGFEFKKSFVLPTRLEVALHAGDDGVHECLSPVVVPAPVQGR